MPAEALTRRPRAMVVNAKALVTLRELRGLSVRQLALKSGLAPSTISRIENGRREAEPATILAIAKGLNVALDAIIR